METYDLKRLSAKSIERISLVKSKFLVAFDWSTFKDIQRNLTQLVTCQEPKN